ncbi:hypothetical protein SAMN05216388_101345 [Halorientalis persicus]|uniref:Uncharacterized protein n=1 Tax=Halorientalis persicus TaxID=1367881 RepID=A0A1H8Q2U4_9EURY|nr:hypothetical protein [Halorientalis persicus]SEO48520.1 hypothetical protein SAMN05216388_101345 [Halorientalis persicus]
MSTKNSPAAGPAQSTNSAPTIEPSVGESLSHREALRTAAQYTVDPTAGDLDDLARAFDAAASLAEIADSVNPEIELADQELVLLAFAHTVTAHSLRRSGRDNIADRFADLATKTVTLVLETNES